MSNLKHGMRYTRLYNIWQCMLGRCKDKKRKNYGQNGIKVCEEWHIFEKFEEWAIKAGYKDNLSIDRKNNNEGYNPENCKWSTEIEQANNKRNNKIITINGESKTIHDWCRYYNINYSTVIRRIKIEGLTENEAITKLLHPGRTKLYTINGITKSLLQWSKAFNIPYKTLSNRVNRGIPIELALKEKGRIYG